jgi:methylenetetrahydrofolate--tRNA-(uracil-5-)-methyltransferase
VRLYEMRPVRPTAAHQTAQLGELVCSNSFRSASLDAAVGLLKEEMRRLGSLVMAVADRTSVPAGTALAVDREQFASQLTAALAARSEITVVREELREVPAGLTIIASGPLTSPALSYALQELFGEKYLYFYDAIAPIVTAESIDRQIVFPASRYGKGGEDYLNCPMTREEYYGFTSKGACPSRKWRAAGATRWHSDRCGPWGWWIRAAVGGRLPWCNCGRTMPRPRCTTWLASRRR